MPAKKKSAKRSQKPATKKAAQKAKPASAKRGKAPKPKSARPAGMPKRPLVAPAQARRMAAFSKRVVAEEAAPVAVRTFNEARAGIEQSKQLDIRSGEIKPVPVKPAPLPRGGPPPAPADVELDAEVEDDGAEKPPAAAPAAQPKPRPQIQPLTGEVAMPKRTNPFDEEFRMATPKKGKKSAPPTRDDLGKIELRMQRGSKDEPIARASPDYLQRSFNRAAQQGKVAATSGPKPEEEPKAEEFEVAMDKGKKRVDAALSDFGDIEIAQQTRRGAKKVGKLDTSDDNDQ